MSLLMMLWSDLQRRAPSKRRAVEFLARRSGCSHSEIDYARRVRNRCAHPTENGGPTRDEVARAVDTLRAVRRAIGLDAVDDKVAGAAAVAQPRDRKPPPTTPGLSTVWAASPPPPAAAPSRHRTQSLAGNVIRSHDHFFDWVADRGEQALANLAIAFGLALLLSGALLWERAPGRQAVGVVLFGLTTATLVLSTAYFVVTRLDLRSGKDWDWEDAGMAVAAHSLWLVAVWVAAVPLLRVGWVDTWMLVSLPFLLVPCVAWSRIFLTTLAPALVVAALAAPVVVLGSAEAVIGAPSGPLGLPADLVDDGTFHRPDG